VSPSTLPQSFPPPSPFHPGDLECDESGYSPGISARRPFILDFFFLLLLKSRDYQIVEKGIAPTCRCSTLSLGALLCAHWRYGCCDALARYPHFPPVRGDDFVLVLCGSLKRRRSQCGHVVRVSSPYIFLALDFPHFLPKFSLPIASLILLLSLAKNPVRDRPKTGPNQL